MHSSYKAAVITRKASHPRSGQSTVPNPAQVRRAAENDLKRAIERGEFVVHFQRQVALDSQRIVGFEALVRRRTAQGDLVAPLEFIPRAERSGLMIPLGRLILERACEQLVAIHRQLPADAQLPWVAVNFSARQLESPGIVDDVVEILTRTGLNPDLLWIEVTETSLMKDPAVCAAVLRKLRAIGTHVSIDDFGTGCSSLRHLQLFPVEQLKIDRSFTACLGIDDIGTSIVIAIITLAHALGIHVVAEGVETAQQRDLLVSLGCDVGQGYFWQCAVPYEDATTCRSELLARHVAADPIQLATRVNVAPLPATRFDDRSSIYRDPRLDILSDRRREAVCRLLLGERVAGIADAMSVSRSTVRNHLSHAFQEFGVSGQQDLMRLFLPPVDPVRLHALR